MPDKIYDFKKFANYLKEQNLVFQEASNFQLLEIDFETEFTNGNILFEENAIFYVENNVKHKGYLSMYDYDVTGLGKYPSFHTADCTIIRGFKERGLFNQKYFFRNTLNVDVLDRQTEVVHQGINLKICYYCKDISHKPLEYYTKDFYEELMEYNEKLKNKKLKRDSSGRPYEWSKISKAYKIMKNYQCENCGFDGSKLTPFDRRFIEVDHIVAQDLINLNEENLQCLCVLCHSQKDELHKKNYSKEKQFKKVKDFVLKFQKELKECNNTYLERFIKKNK